MQDSFNIGKACIDIIFIHIHRAIIYFFTFDTRVDRLSPLSFKKRINNYPILHYLTHNIRKLIPMAPI